MQHIGIVACSAEGAALCYRTICLEGAGLMGNHDHPEVSLHGHSLAEYEKFLEKDDWDGVAELMLSSAEKLASGGADFLVCPDNTIHRAFAQVARRSPRPWLHIAEQVAREAQRRKFKRLGILGTKYLMEGPVYPEKLGAVGIDYRVPGPAERERINQIIFDELVNGKFPRESQDHFGEVIRKLAEQGCDAVVLGCTEIPLIISDESSPLPTLDSTRLLARAALRRAVGGVSRQPSVLSHQAL